MKKAPALAHAAPDDDVTWPHSSSGEMKVTPPAVGPGQREGPMPSKVSPLGGAADCEKQGSMGAGCWRTVTVPAVRTRRPSTAPGSDRESRKPPTAGVAAPSDACRLRCVGSADAARSSQARPAHSEGSGVHETTERGGAPGSDRESRNGACAGSGGWVGGRSIQPSALCRRSCSPALAPMSPCACRQNKRVCSVHRQFPRGSHPILSHLVT